MRRELCTDVVDVTVATQVFGAQEPDGSRQLEIVVEEESQKLELFELWDGLTGSPRGIWLTKMPKIQMEEMDHHAWEMGEERVDRSNRLKIERSQEAHSVFEDDEDGRIKGGFLSEGM